VAENGNKYQKYKQVSCYVIDQFKTARELLHPVRDVDLIRWATKHARDIELSTFKGSKSWTQSFKDKYGIVSRKVTKTMTRKKDETLHSQAIDQFRIQAIEKFSHYHPKAIKNTDQMGLNQEIRRLRTLSHKGEKDTVLMVQRSNALTHSVTIMPTISLEGRLVGKLLLCLNESSNEFGPMVQHQVEEFEKMFPYIKIVCSTSGKLNKQLIGVWINDCFSNDADAESEDLKKQVLLLDSWSGQWNEECWRNNWRNKVDLFKMKIPEGTTGETQPLDTGFNSFFKYVMKRLVDFITIENIDCIVSKRENLVKLIAMTYNQLDAPIFYPLIQAAWAKAGLLQLEDHHYENPRDVCFKTSGTCESENCDNYTMIKCAHCETNLCYQHFFIETHLHL
jgi:hypothetical protein